MTERTGIRAWGFFAAALLPWSSRAVTAPERDTSPAVPPAAIEGVSALVVFGGTPIPDREKRRRYKDVLRAGREIEAGYPAATNLYVVQGKMLEAAQGLVMLDGEEEMRRQMLDLAARLSAAEAPAAARLAADALLTHARLARAGGDAEGVGAAIASFAEKYLNTAAEAQNLMQAMLMAWDADQRPLFEAFRRRMTEDLWDEPGVAAFLRSRFAVKSREGRVFDAKLTCLDGRVLRLPMDTLGNYTLVNFWSGSIADIEDKLEPLKQFEREQGHSVVVIGVNLDRSRAGVERFARQYGLHWPQAFSGLGAEDPAFLRYGMPHLPSYCFVGPCGRVIVEDAHNLIAGRPARGEVRFRADARLTRKMVFLKSGEFLVTAPVGSTDLDRPPELGLRAAVGPANADNRVPRSVLDRLQACFSVPPFRYSLPEEESVKRYEAALDLGKETLARHPKAANSYLARNRMMVAAQGLATLRRDDALQTQAERMALEALAADAPPEARLIADVCATRAALRQLDREERGKIDDILCDLPARYERTGVEAPGLAAAALLALEAGRENLHREWLSLLQLRHGEDPRVRELLMAFGATSHIGRPFKARLTRLDGGVINLPDDFPGKIVCLYFLDLPEEADDRKATLEYFSGLKSYGERYAGDLEIVGISLDTSRETIAELALEQGWNWPITFSGKGLEDVTAQTYGVEQPNRFPHVFIVGQDGRVRHDLPPSASEPRAASALLSTTHAVKSMLTQIHERRVAAAFAEAENRLDKLIADRDGWGDEYERMAHEIYRQRAQARAAQGKWSAALEDAGSAVEAARRNRRDRPPCDGLYAYRAELLEKLERAEEAARDRQAAEQSRFERRKGREQTASDAGAAEADAGQGRAATVHTNVVAAFAEVERRLDDLLSVAGRHWRVYRQYFPRAQARAAQGKLAAALEDADAAVKSAIGHPHNRLQSDGLYEYRAEIFEMSGRAEEADQDREAARQIRRERKDWYAKHGGGPPAFRGRFVPAWNIVGPFALDPAVLGLLGPYRRIVQPKGIPIPESWREFLPPEQGIDFSAVYAGKDGAKAGWRTVEVNRGDWRSEWLLNLSAAYPEIDFAVAYAVAYVFSAQAGTYTVGVGCDDLMTVRINGEHVLTSYGPGTASRGQNVCEVRFKPGWNEIVLKTANFSHEWGFYFEIADSEDSLRFALRPRE